MKYCRKCGKELEDDSLFCSKCGEKVENHEEQNKPKGKGCGCFITFIITISVAIGLLVFALVYHNKHSDIDSSDYNVSGNTSNGERLLSRDATTNDLVITEEMNLAALGVDIVINPKTDIDNLQLKLTHYDKYGQVLNTQYLSVGNVKEGVQVRRSISIAGMSLFDIYKIEKTSISVSCGTVNYMQWG